MKALLVMIVGWFLLSDGGIGAISEDETAIEKIDFKIMVMDAMTDDPIPAAKISIENRKEAYTDFNGIVILEEMILGTYNIEISFASYQKKHFKDFHIKEKDQKLLVKL